MLVAVIDGQGGGIGRSIIEKLRNEFTDDIKIIALGTNSLATSFMIKAGANEGATGENAVKVMARSADIITGPIGIVIPNALLGEITPGMADAIASSTARKVLVPVNQGHFEIVGLENRPLVSNNRDAAARILEIIGGVKG